MHDHQTGLEWSAGIIGESSWTDAQKLAAGCTLLGKRDWRLPTVQELLTLVDYERCDPAVDPAFFRGPFGWTWSGTPAAGASGCAWSVSLVDGFFQPGLPEQPRPRAGCARRSGFGPWALRRGHEPA